LSRKPFFGNWMVAIAEAAAVAGSSELDQATAAQLTKAWDLVAGAADVTVDELAGRIAREAGLKTADFGSADPYAPLVLPGGLAWRRMMYPLRCSDAELVVATSDPLSRDAKREVAMLAGRSVTLEVSPPGAVAAALERTYGPRPRDGSAKLPPPDKVKPGGPHVLVVDDEPGTRALIKSILDEAGFGVTLATDGPDAIRMLSARHDYDLVTLDYWMDQMNGLRVLQQVRAQSSRRDVPIIMVTGAEDRRIAMSLFEAGADDFINKPIDPPLFLLRLQAVMRRRSMR